MTLPEGERIGETLIVQAGWWGHSLGKVTVELQQGRLLLAAANWIDATATARLGDGALIAWADLSATFDTDIRAVRVASDGSQQGDRFTVAASPLPESALVATGGRAGARIAYERAIDYPGTFRLSRVFTRTVAEAPPPRKRAAR